MAHRPASCFAVRPVLVDAASPRPARRSSAKLPPAATARESLVIFSDWALRTYKAAFVSVNVRSKVLGSLLVDRGEWIFPVAGAIGHVMRNMKRMMSSAADYRDNAVEKGRQCARRRRWVARDVESVERSGDGCDDGGC
jgi:hypothetical protein